MRASRLLSILMLLQLRGRMTAEALAAEFEVSVRTIYRDADQLSAAGVPIYADRGPGGGFQLLEGYRTRLTGMTADEAEALVFAGLPATAADLGLGSEAAAAQLKFLAALPSASSEAARRVSDRFYFDPAPWHRRRRGSIADLRILTTAVWEARRIRLRYESWKGGSDRVVQPLGVVLKAGEWYFVADRRGRPAIHKLDSVGALDLLDETFVRPADFDLAAAWREAVASFEASLRRGKAVLRVTPAALPGIDRLGADMAGPVLAARPDPDGVREAEVDIESIAHAAGLLLVFADEIEVVSPPELREALRRRAEAVAALYAVDGANEPV
jgi:predicted DNA-binding transcriptional regulator YafY